MKAGGGQPPISANLFCTERTGCALGPTAVAATPSVLSRLCASSRSWREGGPPGLSRM